MQTNKLLFACFLSVSMLSTACFSMQNTSETDDDTQSEVDEEKTSYQDAISPEKQEALEEQEALNEALIDALIDAAAEGVAEKVEELIKRGANVNYKNPLDLTPLHFAAFLRNAKAILVLLHYGAENDPKKRYYVLNAPVKNNKKVFSAPSSNNKKQKTCCRSCLIL